MPHNALYLPGSIGKNIRIKRRFATNNSKVIECKWDKVPYQCTKGIFFPLSYFENHNFCNKYFVYFSFKNRFLSLAIKRYYLGLDY